MARESTPDNPYTPPSEDKALIAWLQKKVECAKPKVSEQSMKMNLAFVMGQQWLVWDGRSNSFRKPSNRNNDPNAPIRLTFNKIAGLVEGNTARLTKSVPAPEVRPVGDTDEDLDTAKVGTRILAHECDRISWDTLLTDLYSCWVTPLGWSYLHVYWDPSKGPEVGTLDGEPVYEGEIGVDIVPAPEVRVDPNSKNPDLSDARWLEHTTTMTKEAVWETFGVMPVNGEPGRTLADEVVSLVESHNTSQAKDEFVKVHRFWMRPGSRACPKGMAVTWCGETILEHKKKYPYEHGRLPYIQFNLLPGIGMREGRTWVSDVIPMQVDYNDSRSREAAIRRTLTPKVLAPFGAIDTQRLTSRVEVIAYRPSGAQPTFMMPDGRWMSQFQAGMDRSDHEMGERAGASEQSGAAPSTQPAAAILALQEQDDTKLAISAKHLARGIEATGKMILQLVKQFWLEQRVVRTWSEDNTIQVDNFAGSDLDRGFDVHLSSESALPKSKAARTQLAIDLWTQGIITDPHTYVTLLDIPGTDFLSEQLSKDQKRADRENGKLYEGEECEPEHFDDHLVHLKVHNDFRKSVDYEELDEQTKAVVDAHCAIHESLVLQQQAVANGVGPDPEEGPQPGAQTVGEGPVANTDYLDPMTGKPSDPLAGGPSALDDSQVAEKAGIGGTGQPGHVPGVSTDSQAASMGS